MPSPELSVPHALLPGVPPAPPPGGGNLILPMFSMRRRAQKADMTCPRSPSQQMGEPGSQARLSDSQLLSLKPTLELLKGGWYLFDSSL